MGLKGHYNTLLQNRKPQMEDYEDKGNAVIEN